MAKATCSLYIYIKERGYFSFTAIRVDSLACVKHIASVPSEPGSNSDFDYD